MFTSFANDPFFTSSFGANRFGRSNLFDDPFFNPSRIQAPASPTQPLEQQHEQHEQQQQQAEQNEQKYEQKDNTSQTTNQQQQAHQQHMDVYDPFSNPLGAFGSDFGFPSMRRMMRTMQNQMNTDANSGDPNSSCYTYSSSSVSTRGADGKLHSHEQSHESRRVGGVLEESHSEFDSNGNARYGLKRGLIPKQQSRELTAERNGQGESRQLETLHGLTTAEVPSFDQAWDSECAKVDPEKKMLGTKPWDAKQLLIQEEQDRMKQHSQKTSKRLIKNQEKEQQKAIKS